MKAGWWCPALALVAAITLVGAASQPAALPAKAVADIAGDDAAGVWDYAAVDAADGYLAVARMDGVELLRLGRDSHPRLLAHGHHVHEPLPLADHRLLFTNGDSDTAQIVDVATAASIATLPTGGKPDGAIYDPSSGQVLVMDGRDGTVTRIGVAQARPGVEGRIVVGGKLEAPALGRDQTLFINVEDRAALAIVSLRGRGRLLREVPLAGCTAPTGLAFDAPSRLLVSACTNGVAEILDETGALVARLPIGAHPDAVIGDPLHHRVFIPCGGDGTVSEIVLSGTPHLRRVWHTRAGARTGAYDPVTQRLYLPYGAVSRVPGQPPQLVPGSFGILVIDVA